MKEAIKILGLLGMGALLCGCGGSGGSGGSSDNHTSISPVIVVEEQAHHADDNAPAENLVPDNVAAEEAGQQAVLEQNELAAEQVAQEEIAIHAADEDALIAEQVDINKEHNEES